MGHAGQLSTVSELNHKSYAQSETWRNRPIEGNHLYVFLDSLWLKRSWGGEVRNVPLPAAIRLNDNGFREVLTVAGGSKEDKASWTAFLRRLKERGLKGVRRLSFPPSVWGWWKVSAAVRSATLSQPVDGAPTSKVKVVLAMLKVVQAQDALPQTCKCLLALK